MVLSTFLNKILLYKILISIIILGITIIIYFIVKQLLNTIFSKLITKTKTKLDDILYQSINRPILSFILVTGFYLSILNLGFSNTYIFNIFLVAYTLIFLTFVDNLFINIIDTYLVPIVEKTDTHLDDTLVPLIKKGGRIFIYLIGILWLISNLGYDISALLTGVGIGGVALALASKEILENFIGGLIIIFDRPFKLKDWIILPDGDEGVIEEIDIRSTKIRKFDDSLIIIPNSKLLSNKIINMSAMRKRRVLMKIGIIYESSAEKIKLAKDIILKVLENTEGVIPPIRVHFIEYGDFALIFRVEYFIENKGFDFYLDVKEKVNLRIKEEFDKNGIKFAYPTYTIFLEKN